MKKWKVLGLVVGFTVLATVPTFAGEWKQDTTGYWYVNDDGTYPAEKWQEIDGKWYYFDGSGYMVHDVDIDGYHLGSDGAMIEQQNTGAESTSSKLVAGEYRCTMGMECVYDRYGNTYPTNVKTYQNNEGGTKTLTVIDQDHIQVAGLTYAWDSTHNRYQYGDNFFITLIDGTNESFTAMMILSSGTCYAFDYTLIK